MFRLYATVVLTALIALPTTAFCDGPFPLYEEPYRPGYHFSPARNWMNEENGLVYFNGNYHLFYQHNPFNAQWGNMSWGHAVSTDLVHWQNLPVAIPGENGVMAFSGTAIYDEHNTSGLGTGVDGPLIAAYTGWTFQTGRQDQRLAFSNDGGFTWTKFSGNPVVDILSNEFRDPKVLWHEPTQRWIMVNSHGGQKRVTFWSSSDLKSWQFESEFNAFGMPGSIGGWELPDLFELPIDGSPNNTRWVLVITPAQGSPAGGNGVMYFIGDFDGSTFTNENPPSTILWADFGRDWDGVLSWENIPDADGRRIWIGIMNSYGTAIPTTPWRSCLSIPREVTLTQTPDGVRIRQSPVDELQALRGAPLVMNNVAIPNGVDPLDGSGLEGDMLEIRAIFDPGDALLFGLRVREGPGNRRTEIGYDMTQGEMYVNRINSGDTSNHPNAGGIHDVEMDRPNGLVTLHIFVDRSTLEVFGNDGEAVVSNLIFPDPTDIGVSLFSLGGTATLVSFEAYPLISIWPDAPVPEAGSNVVARWSMSPVPQNGNGHQPRIVDSRTCEGEGSLLGDNDPLLFEYTPAVDNLFFESSAPGGVLATSFDVPPASMFSNEQNGGSSSYNAQSLASHNGILYCPVDFYGEEFAFTGAFSIEMFFKTDGDRSNAGLMQLLLQGETLFRYGLIANEGGAGNVRFALNDRQGHFEILDIVPTTGANYCDGEWHYLLATYDPTAGDNGEMTLTVSNEDGTRDTVVHAISGAFQGLPNGGDGNLLIGREDFNLDGGDNNDPRTFLGLIDELQISSGIVTEEERLGLPKSVPLVRWSMDPAPDLPVPPNGANPVSLDQLDSDGQGSKTGNSGAPSAVDHLWSFNGLPGGAFATSPDVAPTSMFDNGFDGGTFSYDAGAIEGLNGALFFPQDQYGDEFQITGGFSIELFFKTEGDQSGAGIMHLVTQGENANRFELTVNESTPGNVRLRLDDRQGQTAVVDIHDEIAFNYADGLWHYVLAVYDPDAGASGELSLSVANENGSSHTATTSIAGSFQGLPSGVDGNMFIGRKTFPNGPSARTFLGLIDEVQITRGQVEDRNRLGVLPGPTLKGDMNCDGVVDLFDVDPFVTALVDPAAYAFAFPLCDVNLADMNGDATIDGDDTATFITSLLTP